jgi:hypothetical protein
MGGKRLDVGPQAGEADEPGRQIYADRRVRRDSPSAAMQMAAIPAVFR